MDSEAETELMARANERELLLFRLQAAWRLSRVEAEYMLETFGDGEPDPTGDLK